MIKSYLNKYVLHIALVQAILATLGSLYFSEIRHFTPCLLCWYQRILMYPLVILLTVAIIRKEKSIAYYILPVTLLGFVIGSYHYLLQWTILAELTPISCNAYGPCTEIQALFLGFITIPFLSLLAFALISILMLFIIKSNKNDRRK